MNVANQAAVRETRTVTLTNSKSAVQVCDARNDDSSTTAGYIIKTALRKADPEAAVRVSRTEKQLYVQTDRLIIG